MAVNFYEGIFIIDSGLFARDPEGVSKQIDDAILALGGEVIVSRIFEERKLAYPINGQRKGVYWLVYFHLESTKLVELDRQYKLLGGIIRFMLLKHDEKIGTVLAEYARSGKIVQTHEEITEEVVDEDAGEDSDSDGDNDGDTDRDEAGKD